jgi:hypothetical protein
MEDTLSCILEAYFAPTLLEKAELPWGLYGPAYVDLNVEIGRPKLDPAPLVSRHWRDASCTAQARAVKSVRTVFFRGVVEMLHVKCLDTEEYK